MRAIPIPSISASMTPPTQTAKHAVEWRGSTCVRTWPNGACNAPSTLPLLNMPAQPSGDCVPLQTPPQLLAHTPHKPTQCTVPSHTWLHSATLDPTHPNSTLSVTCPHTPQLHSISHLCPPATAPITALPAPAAEKGKERNEVTEKGIALQMSSRRTSQWNPTLHPHSLMMQERLTASTEPSRDSQQENEE